MFHFNFYWEGEGVGLISMCGVQVFDCHIPGGGAVGISESVGGVSSDGISLAGGLTSGAAVLAAGASLGGAAPKIYSFTSIISKT